MQPVVVALCGLPGSGKSTLAAALERERRFTLLDRDRLRGKWPWLGYETTDKRLLNETMRAAMLRHVLAGQSVIVDGMTFARASERDAFEQAARTAGARWHLVWLDCDPELARRRVTMTGMHPASDRNALLVDTVQARFEPPASSLRLDARQTVAALLRRILLDIG